MISKQKYFYLVDYFDDPIPDVRFTPTEHPFHLVDCSPWPLLAALGALFVTMGGVLYMHFYSMGFKMLFFGLFYLLIIMGKWWRDVVVEGTYEGQHTLAVQKGLRYGMILFIISEVMFFFAFFWAFFHSSLSPAVQIGGIYPPEGIEVFNPWGMPLLNTIILLTSGATVTWTHHAIVAGDPGEATAGLRATIGLGILFTFFQLIEYYHATFTIADGIYGSVFFLATGFHGLHVLIGTIFLGVCLYRLHYYHFTRDHHFGFEAAAWYWHFVDVVWLFLFISIYWWGS